MSIIFEKLKKLKRPPSPKGLEKPVLARGENVYTFSKLIFSPKGVLLIGSTIIAFAFISFYSLSYLKNLLDSSSKNAIIIQRPDQGLNDPADMEFPEDEYEEGSQEDGEQSKEKKAPTLVEEFKVPQFFMSESQDEEIDQDDSLGTTPPKPILPPKDPSKKSVYDVLDKNKLKHISPKTESDPILVFTPRHSQQEPKTVDQKTIAQSYRPSSPKPQNKSWDAASKKQVVKKEKNMPSTDVSPKAAQPQANSLIELKRKIKRRQEQKISQISSLSSNLEEAVQTNDNQKTDQLIEQLSNQTNKNSIYYLKLNAFQLIRQKEYARARTFLNKVLDKDDTDLEAGLNMAIIEIRTQDLAAAKKRLIRLNELYPSQPVIERLLNQL